MNEVRLDLGDATLWFVAAKTDSPRKLE